MDVRVVVQLLVSRVQNKMSSRFELLLTQLLVQRSPSRMKQQVVEFLSITENQTGQLIWQREHNLEVIHLW